MEKNFDFNSVGKRTPYQVPDGFFTNMQQEVLNRVSKEAVSPTQGNVFTAPKRVFWKHKASLLAAAAVAIVLLVMTFHFVVKPSQTADQMTVEMAFDNLSTDDQDYLLAVYAEDIFLEGEEGF